jgi:hypothetical protein
VDAFSILREPKDRLPLEYSFLHRPAVFPPRRTGFGFRDRSALIARAGDWDSRDRLNGLNGQGQEHPNE